MYSAVAFCVILEHFISLYYARVTRTCSKDVREVSSKKLPYFAGTIAGNSDPTRVDLEDGEGRIVANHLGPQLLTSTKKVIW